MKNNHDAIIEPIKLHIVQAEIARRKALGKVYSGTSVFWGEQKCITLHLHAETMQQKLQIANARMMAASESIISDCISMRQVLSDATALNSELDSLNEKMNVVSELVKLCAGIAR